MATGVLVVLLGRATRLADMVQVGRKRYTATVSLGSATDTDDAEGDIVQQAPVPDLSSARLESALAPLRGEILQRPPVYAALKVDGQRAYARARRGETVDLAPRAITIDELTLVSVDGTHVVLDVACSKGTYIRALARDLAISLGTVGHLSALRRTAVGSFTIDEARAIDSLDASDLTSALQPVTRALPSAPVVHVSDADVARLRNGQPVAVAVPPEEVSAVWVVDDLSQPVCLGRSEADRVWPRLVL